MATKSLQEQMRLLRVAVEATAEIPFLTEDKKEPQRKVADEAWEAFYNYSAQRLAPTVKSKTGD